MNKGLKKRLTVSTTVTMGMGLLLPTVSVVAAPAVVKGWAFNNGTWNYYQNGKKLMGCWAKDSQGWCFLSAVDGSWVQSGWVQDSQGWCYIQNGYWVEHSMWVKDSQGWNFIQNNGYWDGKSALAFNPTEVTTAAVASATYDSNTDNQNVAITVNGAAATVADLNAAGYNVKFSAQDSMENGDDITTELFSDTATGKLNMDLPERLNKTIDSSGANVYVQAILTKGSNVITTGLQKIIIKNNNPSDGTITDYTLYNDTIDVDMNSTKLVVGETAKFSDITVNIGGKLKTLYANDNDYTVKSSNSSVISVASNNELTAISTGKSTLTISYGKYTKTVPVTVVKDERELTKVKAEKTGTTTAITSIKTALYKAVSIQIEPLDQYGDPYTDEVYCKSLNADVISLNSSDYSVTAGTPETLDYTAVDTGSATVCFYSDSDMTFRLSNSVLLFNVIENSDVAKSAITLYNPTTTEISNSDYGSSTRADYSTDTTIDVSGDRFALFEFNQYNSDGVLLGDSSFNDCDISVAESKTGVLVNDTVSVINDKIVAEAGKAGTATIKVKDNATGLTYMQRITVTDKNQ